MELLDREIPDASSHIGRVKDGCQPVLQRLTLQHQHRDDHTGGAENRGEANCHRHDASRKERATSPQTESGKDDCSNDETQISTPTSGHGQARQTTTTRVRDEHPALTAKVAPDHQTQSEERDDLDHSGEVIW